MRVVEALWLLTQVVIPSHATNETQGLNDLLNLTVKHCQSQWLNGGVCLHGFVTLAQFVFKRRERLYLICVCIKGSSETEVFNASIIHF